MVRQAIILALTALISWVQPVVAQQLQVLPGGFLVIDQEALFSTSAFGQRILAETEQATKDLVAENRAIEAQLIAEERALTERRPELAADEFRRLADAFDEKVQTIRDEQSRKSDAIGETLDRDRREFFQAIVPILAQILRETRAVAILDKRTVLISVSVIDVTETAVARIDAAFGDQEAPISPAQESGSEAPAEPGDSASPETPAEGGSGSN